MGIWSGSLSRRQAGADNAFPALANTGLSQLGQGEAAVLAAGLDGSPNQYLAKVLPQFLASCTSSEPEQAAAQGTPCQVHRLFPGSPGASRPARPKLYHSPWGVSRRARLARSQLIPTGALLEGP